MASDASQVLGATELAGALVNPKGMAKKMTAATAGQVTGGAVGAFAARTATGDAYEGSEDVPQFGRVGYLAATSDEIALVKTKTGALKMKISDEVLARISRSQILATDFDEGKMLSHLKITFQDGTIWEFDVPKASKNDARSLVSVLESPPR